VGKNAKLGIMAGVVLVIGLLVYLTQGALLGLGVVVVGALAVVALLQRMPDDDEMPDRSKKTKGGGKSKLDTALEARSGGATTATKPAPSKPPAGGLPTWSPGGLDTWSPSSAGEDAPAAESDSGKSGSWDSWDEEWDGDSTTTTIDEPNPLDALDRLDDIDPIAEVERLDAIDADPLGSLDTAEELDSFELDEFEDEFDLGEPEPPKAAPAKSGGFSFSSAPAVINEEEIKTADDIMAASHATELELPAAEGADGDSELARLLAKVQARLSAYE
jgi:hypothetical protein